MQGVSSKIKKCLKFMQESNYSEAIKLLEKMIKKSPRDSQALSLLGQIQAKTGNFKEAIAALEKAKKHVALPGEVLSKLAYAYEKTNDYDKAIDLYKKCLEKNCHKGQILDGIGRTLTKKWDDYEALPYLFRAAEFVKDDPWVFNNIAYAAKRLGLYNYVDKYYREAFRADPKNQLYLSCLIFNSHSVPHFNLQNIQDLSKAYYNQYLAPIKKDMGFDFSKRKPKLKKRIGYVSGDLRSHPVAAYLLPILKGLLNDYDIYCYNTYELEDETTEEFKELAVKYTNLHEVDVYTAAQEIYDDEIDILFDMSGYTRGTRLDIFTLKPAPIQVSSIGYFGTLAMPEMDYILADAKVVKDGEEKYFTEKIYKMETCYTHCHYRDVKQERFETPAVKNGFITFGSMNNFYKVSPDIIAFWSELLKETPNSKLLVDAIAMKSESNKDYLIKTFKENGVSEDRLIVKSSKGRENFLKVFDEIDIALDPFPYGGGTTTFESLRKGVPIITLDADRWIGRQSADFIDVVGCNELIAKSKEEYKEKAVELAGDIDRLNNYRKTLKEKTENSKLSIGDYLPRYKKFLEDIQI